MSKHNRSCPKCGASCVVCGFEDTKAGYDHDVNPQHGDVYWDAMGVCCSQCDWELETRSANS